MRTAEPHSLFDSKQIFSAQPLFWDDVNVTGTSSTTWNQNRASSLLAVNDSAAGRRVRQTFRRFNYQPGKSQLIAMTGVIGTATTGITQRIGYFDDNNGLFFEMKDGVMGVVIRSNATGTPTDNRVVQENWNLDRMDGHSKSGWTADWTKAQIFHIDFQWLGVGRVRFGLNIDGALIYVHEFDHANDESVVYMSTPNLPLRYEIINDGTGPASDLEAICTTVLSEGGTEETGQDVYLTTDGSGPTLPSASNLYAIIGVRLNASSSGARCELHDVSVIVESNDDFEWRVLYNPTVATTGTSSFAYTAVANTPLEAAYGTPQNTVTGGHPVTGGYGKSGSAESASAESQMLPGFSYAGVPTTLVLCVKPLSINTAVEAGCVFHVGA